MATWKSNRIVDIISEIEDNKFVLPVIQRRLVWDEEKMELLFDTLLKGDSFGGIMVIEEEKGNKPLFNFRPFTKDGENIGSVQVDCLTQMQNFVIDGQQRLQSFYIGLKGSINGRILYFDLYSDYNHEFEFKFENEQAKLPKYSKDNDTRQITEHNWYLASDLLRRLKDTNDEDQVSDEIIKSQVVTEENRKQHIVKNVKSFYKNIITAEAIGISKVSLNKTFDETTNRQKIVELFRRLNDGGTKLSPFDLVASILKGFEWEMEAFLDNVLSEFKDIGMSQDNLIKLIFILQENHNKEMSDITASDAKFAIDQRERIWNTLECVRKFLHYSALYNYYKEGNRSFIPLYFIAYHIFHKEISNESILYYFDNHDANNDEFPKIKRWVYYSLLNGIFKSKGAGWIPYKTGIRKILETIKNYKNLAFPTSDLFQVYYNHGLTFTEQFNQFNLEALDSQFVYYLIYDKNLTVRIQDIDHIMPKNILITKGCDWNKINSVRNFQLLDYGTNRGLKNGHPFKQWLQNNVTDQPAYLKRHLIPSDSKLWSEDKFDEFINQRGILILEKLEISLN